MKTGPQYFMISLFGSFEEPESHPREMYIVWVEMMVGVLGYRQSGSIVMNQHSSVSCDTNLSIYNIGFVSLFCSIQ